MILESLRQKWHELYDRLAQRARKLPPVLLGREDTRGSSETLTQRAGCPLLDMPRWQQISARQRLLPARYRAAFNLAPVAADTPWAIPREQKLQQFHAALARWQRQLPTLLAVVGPDGCGRTSFLNALEARLPEATPVHRLNLSSGIRDETVLAKLFAPLYELDADASWPEVQAQLTRPRDQIILLDNIDALLLRTPGAYRAFKTLLATMLASQSRTLWVVSFGAQAWRRADHTYQVGRYFSSLITLDYFTQEEFHAVLRSRITHTGLTLRFNAAAPDDGGVTGAAPDTAPDAAEMDAAVTAYLDKLYELSGGNLPAALLHWHCATHIDAGAQTIQADALEGVDFGAIKSFAAPHHFTLAEMLTHGGLTLAEHQTLFRLSETESRIILYHLHAHRVVERREADGENIYYVDPALYTPIANALITAHVLY